MYTGEVNLEVDIRDILGYSKYTLAMIKKKVKKKIDEYRKVHKLTIKRIDVDVTYVAKIKIKKKAIEHDLKIDLMDMLKREKL